MGESNEDICDQEQRPPSSNSLGCVSCTTFNILAPIYKRLDNQVCLVVVRIVLLEEVACDLLGNCGMTVVTATKYSSTARVSSTNFG